MLKRHSVVAKPSGSGVFDADLNTKLMAVGFRLPPRSSVTIDEMIKIHESQKYLKTYEELKR